MRLSDHPPEHYMIGTFADMVGLPQSKVRFYERSGLLPVRKLPNGYRYFLPEDAFRMNAFRVLLSYGFSIEDAIAMLEEAHSSDSFIETLVHQREALFAEQERLQSRVANIERTLSLIRECEHLSLEEMCTDIELSERFDLVDFPDHVFCRASHGRDFSVSTQNSQALAEFVSLLPVTRYMRIISRVHFDNNHDEVDPDYICGLPVSERHRLKNSPEEQIELIRMGKCLRYIRRETRESGKTRASYAPILSYMRDHGYRLRGDMLLVPTFLNLDGQGADIEYIYAPIE